MVVLDATIVNIALPSAQRALGFSIVDRQWVVTAYALAFGSLLLFGGRLGDLIGRKVTLLAGAIFGAGAVICGTLLRSGPLRAPSPAAAPAGAAVQQPSQAPAMHH
jgi:MFS family permease